MSIPADLLRFVRAHRDELTLSIYVEATPADPAERRNWRVLLRQQLSQARTQLESATQEERDAFERCAEHLSAELPTEQSLPAGSAWAGFCAAGGDCLALTIPAGVETLAHWGPGARVVPYLRVAEDETALVVQVDRLAARISRLEHGALHTLAEFTAEVSGEATPPMGDAPRHGFHVGTRGDTITDDLQRQRREASERMHAALLRKLPSLAEGEVPMVVGGAPESAAHIFRLLPAPLTGRAALAAALKMDDSPAAIPVIREALHALRDRRQQQRVEDLRDAAYRSGRAALGYEVTAQAASHGAIAELIFTDSAWRKHPQEIEHIVQRALADGADVSWAESAAMETTEGDSDGLIAGLRFPLVRTGG
jgi:hypothetical protein